MRSNKGTVFFFFPGKVYWHSLTRFSRFSFFFFPTFGKKKIQWFFFFFPGKVCKPLTRRKNLTTIRTAEIERKKGQNRAAAYVLGFLHALFEISYGIQKVPGRKENTALISCVAVSRPIAERSRAEAINELVKFPAHPLFTFED